MSACWHCLGTDRCRCLTCDGPCKACEGRRAYERDREYLEAFDPRKRVLWRLERPEAPAKPYLVYLPLEARSGAKPKVRRMRKIAVDMEKA